jgi:plastocyanin
LRWLYFELRTVFDTVLNLYPFITLRNKTGYVETPLTAKSMAFNKSAITVSAGAQVTINFDNQDSGIPHNFAAYTDSSASKSIFVGETITGPNQTTYTFTAPATPGSYFFRCDVHPTVMTGTFTVQ